MDAFRLFLETQLQHQQHAALGNREIERFIETHQSDWMQPFLNKGIKRYFDAFCKLPRYDGVSTMCVEEGTVSLGQDMSFEGSDYTEFVDQLKHFSSWRKGPFQLGNVMIDTEWRSDMKWDRLNGLDFTGQRVCDVGCGSGYYLFRLLDSGARYVLGCDPYPLFFFQHMIFRQYTSCLPLSYCPVGWQGMHGLDGVFDTVLCMGILYHQKDVSVCLNRLIDMIKPGGRLVLETLIVDDSYPEGLVPAGRYGNMRNVTIIPTLKQVTTWLKECNATSVEVLDVTATTSEEQRATEWILGWSFLESLDPLSTHLTVEGHPAPVRAICVAEF